MCRVMFCRGVQCRNVLYCIALCFVVVCSAVLYYVSWCSLLCRFVLVTLKTLNEILKIGYVYLLNNRLLVSEKIQTKLSIRLLINNEQYISNADRLKHCRVIKTRLPRAVVTGTLIIFHVYSWQFIMKIWNNHLKNNKTLTCS